MRRMPADFARNHIPHNDPLRLTVDKNDIKQLCASVHLYFTKTNLSAKRRVGSE